MSTVQLSNVLPRRRHRVARRYPRWVSWPYAFTLGSAVTTVAFLTLR